MLTGKQRRYLRGLGHHLEPVVHVGKEGLSGGVVGALDAALLEHELVKVRLADAVGFDRRTVAAGLADAAGAELAQVLGRTVLLYRARPAEAAAQMPEKPSIRLPPG